MATKQNVTPELVIGKQSMRQAIADVVVFEPEPDSELVNAMISEALQLYHDAGRTDVDDHAEMLSVCLHDIYVQTTDAVRGADLAKALVIAIVEVSTYQVGG